MYLNELDQFVKHDLRCRFYFRYVDDLVLVAPERERLVKWCEAIDQFLEKRLLLELKDASAGRVSKPDTVAPHFPGILKRVSEGADFLGYIVRPDYVLVRNRVVNNLKQRLESFSLRFVQPFAIDGKPFQRLWTPPDAVAELRQVLASYLGHFRHASAYRLVSSLFSRFDWLNVLFRRDGYRIEERLKTRRSFRSMRTQVNFFRILLKDYLLLFQVGRYTEVYDRDAVMLNRHCGIRLQSLRGIETVAGVPAAMTRAILERLLMAGFQVAWVKECGAGRFIRNRQVTALYGGCSGHHDMCSS